MSESEAGEFSGVAGRAAPMQQAIEQGRWRGSTIKGYNLFIFRQASEN